MTQEEYKEISLDTLNFFGRKQCEKVEYVNGIYTTKSCDLQKLLNKMIVNTRLYDNKYQFIIPYKNFQSIPNYFVFNDTTIEGALFLFGGNNKVGILNFASAIKAGGGWINGRVAQEEDIMRKTTLFPSLVIQDEFYKEHTKDNPFYSDTMIYSPNVYIIKDKNFQYCTLKEINVVTSAAINLTDIRNNTTLNNYLNSYNSNNNIDLVNEIMTKRMQRILLTFIENNIKNIVLGAFGCGVFGQDANNIANIWKYLLKDKHLEKYFDNIVFAVLDNSPNKCNYTPFENLFKQN